MECFHRPISAPYPKKTPHALWCPVLGERAACYTAQTGPSCAGEEADLPLGARLLYLSYDDFLGQWCVPIYHN